MWAFSFILFLCLPAPVITSSFLVSLTCTSALWAAGDILKLYSTDQNKKA